MKGKLKALLVMVLSLGLGISTCLAGGWKYGLGFNTGISRLEGDINGAKLSPILSGHIRVLPVPYLALEGELGYSKLSSSHPSLSDFKLSLVPFELNLIFNFLPFSKVNPYIFTGGGGVFWNASGNRPTPGLKKGDGLDSFLKAGGGLEFRVSPRFGINLGAAFRFSLTDAFDLTWSGDENDQVLDMHAGFTYYFNKSGADRDHDSIPDELDLMPDVSEDADGYLDHDGIPEKNPNPIAMSGVHGPVDGGDGARAPVVIHHLIVKAESGKDISVKAHVYSDIDLRVVAILYRPVGTRRWNVVKLEEAQENLYAGDIPGYAVTTDGLEYCVVAVDETLSGVGYSGLPSKPINVEVLKSGTQWRIVGGAVGAATIGTASYLVLRKQE